MLDRHTSPSKTHAVLATLSFFLLVSLSNQVGAREIVDMAGRKVTLPERITKVYAAQPYTYVLMSALAPERLLGLLGPLSEKEKRLAPRQLASLPVLGAGMGPGRQVNMEMILALRPDIVLMKGGPQSNTQRMTGRFAKLGIPVVFVDLDRIEHYPAGIEFTAKLLGKEERGKALADYSRNAIAKVQNASARIPPAKRVRVYYAESADGLTTECDQSFHADAIKMAGGTLVHQCELSRHIGMEKVSMEQILAYNPEVIISYDPHFAAFAKKDPRWQGIQAVATGRIYTVPRSPFNWIDRPPSITRVMGIQWLAHILYPENNSTDLRVVTREFQRLFFGVELSEETLNALLN